MNEKAVEVISVSNLRVHYPVSQGILGRTAGFVKAVDGISFTVKRGEAFALVGESGCGKTTTAQAITGLTDITSGSINLHFSDFCREGFNWKASDALTKKKVRGRVQMIFQDPHSSLNPRMTVRSIIEEPLIIHHYGKKEERYQRVLQLMAQVGLSPEYLDRYPHEFSGGQRQRIGIARALVTGPELIIADEPVSALDVSIQAQIINLMQDLRHHFNLTQLFISHDLAVVRHIADRIAVMYKGIIVEYGRESDLFNNPLHPYTHLLLESVPAYGKSRMHLPDSTNETLHQPFINGACPFYPRCVRRNNGCTQRIPELTVIDDFRGVACFNV